MTFLLGVGAQKCGTTWLHHYLSQHGNVNFGMRKEYHVWDALEIELCRGFFVHKQDDLIHKLQTEHGAYEQYFLSLMTNKITLTGDFTPSYSGLSKACLELIKKKLEAVGFTVKVIFLMRDPFERCWSAVRMQRRMKLSTRTELEDLESAYCSEQFAFRTNYKKTIESLEAVFHKKNIFYGIYEELFTSQKIKELSVFCCLPYKGGSENKKINFSPKLDTHAEVLRQQIREFYAGVYDFCYERFPQTKSLWP